MGTDNSHRSLLSKQKYPNKQNKKTETNPFPPKKNQPSKKKPTPLKQKNPTPKSWLNNLDKLLIFFKNEYTLFSLCILNNILYFLFFHTLGSLKNNSILSKCPTHEFHIKFSTKGKKISFV